MNNQNNLVCHNIKRLKMKEDDEVSSLDSTVTNTPSNLPSGELSKIYEIELGLLLQSI